MGVRRPDFVIAGTARSGTTSLADALRRHPDVFVTSPKEPHHLALGGRTPTFSGPGDAETINRAIVVDPGAYLDLYRGAEGKVTGDGSSETLYYPDRAIPRLQELNPDVRVVILLREPAARAYSAHQYLQARGFETLDFADALAAEPERTAAGYHHLWHYRAMGEYTWQVKAYRDAFGPEAVRVWFFPLFERDPRLLLEQVLTHVGVDPARGDLDAIRRINGSGQARSQTLQSLIQGATRRPALREAVKKVMPYDVRERIRGMNLRRTGAPAEAAAALSASLEADGHALQELLGQPVPWLRR